VRTGPPPVFNVRRAIGHVNVDGMLKTAEWGGLNRDDAVRIEQQPNGRPAAPASYAWPGWDDEALYVSFDNKLDSAQPIRAGDEWGTDDAVEVALRDAGDPGAPILVVRGFPSGAFRGSDESNAPDDAVRRLGESVEYAARIESPDRWTAEWRIPFAALNIKPSVGCRLEANLTVRKTARPLWLMWQGTGRWSWEVGRAGVLELR
jgi:hypothetical protein